MLLSISFFVVLNKLVVKTQWWQNFFVYTKQFKNKEQYDIVNVGSNPARFAFFYEDVMGQNWSTGTQGLDFDLLVLKEYQSHLKKGAVVLLPIVAFSSVSGYLGTPKSLSYLSKFASIIKESHFDKKYNIARINRYCKYPLFYNSKAFIYLLHDEKKDERLHVTENCLPLDEMRNDAQSWIEVWKKEFRINELNGILPEHLQEGRRKSIDMMCEMITFLKEMGMKPVIISPPMSISLMKYFTPEVREAYIYSFIKAIQSMVDVPYLDYLDSEFQKNNYYYNALFLNLHGRKEFTKEVLKDLKLSLK